MNKYNDGDFIRISKIPTAQDALRMIKDITDDGIVFEQETGSRADLTENNFENYKRADLVIMITDIFHDHYWISEFNHNYCQQEIKFTAQVEPQLKDFNDGKDALIDLNAMYLKLSTNTVYKPSSIAPFDYALYRPSPSIPDLWKHSARVSNWMLTGCEFAIIDERGILSLPISISLIEHSASSENDAASAVAIENAVRKVTRQKALDLISPLLDKAIEANPMVKVGICPILDALVEVGILEK